MVILSVVTLDRNDKQTIWNGAAHIQHVSKWWLGLTIQSIVYRNVFECIAMWRGGWGKGDKWVYNWTLIGRHMENEHFEPYCLCIFTQNCSTHMLCAATMHHMNSIKAIQIEMVKHGIENCCRFNAVQAYNGLKMNKFSQPNIHNKILYTQKKRENSHMEWNESTLYM